MDRFPWRKVPRYIFAQILGSFMAGLLLVPQYRIQLNALAQEFIARGESPNSLGGPGNALCPFLAPEQANLGFVFLNEFFVDRFIG